MWSRPSFGTETTRNPRKPAVSSLSRHRDHTESLETDSLVPTLAPRPHGFARNQQSRPSIGTETARNPRKPAVSSHFKHRDHTESPETSSLVPLQAPRPLGIPENRQSRPSPGTETARNPRIPTVSSLFRHRDHADSPETSSLVPLQAPRPLGFLGKRQSRPSFSTETARIRPKPAVSSHFRHRDHTKSPKTCSLVPLQAPRPLGFPGNRQSRPYFGTETARNPRKPAVSSHFRHRDHTESPETNSLVPPSAPRPHGILENRKSRPSSGTETARIRWKPIVSSLFWHRDHSECVGTGCLV